MSGNNRVALDMDELPEPPWAERFRLWLESLLDGLGKESWDLSAVLCGDALSARLNGEYRGKDGPTDVLSFPLGDWVEEGAERRYLAGDLVISLTELARNAVTFGVTENEELKRLAVHGVLHLSGMDHETNDADEPMLALQETILERFTEVVLF